MSIYLNLLRHPIVAVISNHIDTYPTPINLSYMWSFGSLAGMALVIQIITGVLLAMHYAPEIHLAFSSVEHIMRDVRGGVALRYIHANGASMFFIVVYLHMFRAFYYGSYFQPRANLWYSGIIIFFLMMATAFMGYVLPWGQMSFWGATVITNLFSAIPVIGNSIVQLLWGGFSVDNPTLNRFFSLHYLVPFLIAGLAILHLVLLHQHGSNNPLGILGLYDKIPFYPYYYVKDLFAFFLFIWVFSFFVIYAPNYMGHPDNYIEANPLVTPAHIVPEWYFLPFYAVLRTIPDKLGGVALMGFAIIILALLPVVDTSVFRSNFFKPLNIWFFWYFFSDSISLGWIGQEVVESPFIEMANFVTFSYFWYFIPMLPVIGFLENAIITYELRSASLGSPWTPLRLAKKGELPYKISKSEYTLKQGKNGQWGLYPKIKIWDADNNVWIFVELDLYKKKYDKKNLDHQYEFIPVDSFIERHYKERKVDLFDKFSDDAARARLFNNEWYLIKNKKHIHNKMPKYFERTLKEHKTFEHSFAKVRNTDDWRLDKDTSDNMKELEADWTKHQDKQLKERSDFDRLVIYLKASIEGHHLDSSKTCLDPNSPVLDERQLVDLWFRYKKEEFKILRGIDICDKDITRRKMFDDFLCNLDTKFQNLWIMYKDWSIKCNNRTTNNSIKKSIVGFFMSNDILENTQKDIEPFQNSNWKELWLLEPNNKTSFLTEGIDFFYTLLDSPFLFINSWLYIFQLGFIILYLLFLGTRYTRTGEFALLLNKIACLYLLFHIWISTNMIIMHSYDNNILNEYFYSQDLLFLQGFILIASLTIILFFYGIIDRFFISNSYETEYPLIILLILFGAVVLFKVDTFIDFIIAIEIVTFGSYILVAYEQRNRFSVYAGVQYFILGSIPSAMLILSISWIYGTYGIMKLQDLDLIANIGIASTFQELPNLFLALNFLEKGVYISNPYHEYSYFIEEFTIPILITKKIYLNIQDVLVFSIQNGFNQMDWNAMLHFLEFKQHKAIGILLFFSYNLLFKLTAAPFHFWALSIYEKAPISSVTILSIFTKVMVVLLIIKVFYTAFFAFKIYIITFYILLGLLTALIAIIGAFITTTIKKFFVYSSMGHVAFMLIPIALFNVGGAAATIHYLIIYILSSFIMWFILFIRKRSNHSLLFFKEFKSTDPLLGILFSMLIFSMSGIPPFGGFFVKLDVLVALIENSNFFVAFFLFFCTVASFFYYLRLIKIIYFDNKEDYQIGDILSSERINLIIILFLILTSYSFLVQMPLLYTELEFWTAVI